MAAAPAYGIVAQALGGTMSITGQAGGEPTRCGVSIGDLAAALYGRSRDPRRPTDARSRPVRDSIWISRCSIAR